MVEFGFLLFGEEPLAARIMLALVAQGVGAAVVVTTRALSDPIGAVARYLGDGLSGFALSEQPEDVEMAAGDRGFCLPIALLPLVSAQMLVEFDSSWHTPSIPPELI
ncbi:MAG TPA: hypothetical protein VFB38_22045 [Chthonomonadaceae bacterium]|nr:hypothetical protein [Chthonomonadaceae bacterium]